ncbi:MAG TPA: hypothetical protein VMW73_01400 [Spirochaetia bacterium]|nr:hypothetical protein [Spirochaetia bacterium]
MSRHAAAILMVFLAAASLAAQSQVVIAFLGVSQSPASSAGAALSTDDIRVLENSITSYLSQVADSENYGLIIPNNREQLLARVAPELTGNANQTTVADLGGDVAARALVAGIALHTGNRYSLALALIRVDTGKLVNRVTGDFPGYADLVAGCRGLVFALFQVSPLPAGPAAPTVAGTQAAPSGERAQPELQNQQTYVSVPSLSMVAGTWKGDKGITSVRIGTDGRASAEIADGNSMKLNVTIEGDQIVVLQDEPNAPKMYLPFFPYSVAVQIVDLARPMSWTFRLTRNHETLTGTKQTSFFRIDRGTVVSVDNTYSRPAEWQRLK